MPQRGKGPKPQTTAQQHLQGGHPQQHLGGKLHIAAAAHNGCQRVGHPDTDSAQEHHVRVGQGLTQRQALATNQLVDGRTQTQKQHCEKQANDQANQRGVARQRFSPGAVTSPQRAADGC
jgi:hypothetical protein